MGVCLMGPPEPEVTGGMGGGGIGVVRTGGVKCCWWCCG